MENHADAFRRATPDAGLTRHLARAGDLVAQLCTVLAALALLAVVGINGANVVGRYFLGAALSWAEEAMLYLMIFIVFAAGAAVTWRGTHMRLEVFVERMPRLGQRAAVLLSTALGVAILLSIAFASFEVVTMLHSFGQTSDALEIPMWIPQSCVLGGFALFAILMVLRLAVHGAQLPPSGSDALPRVDA